MFSSEIKEKNSDIDFSDEEKRYIQNKNQIIAHNEMNWIPFNYNEDGKAKGFSIDYMNLLALKIGIKVKYLAGHSWDDFMSLLQTDQLDLIINIAKNPQRNEIIEFSEPFISVKNAIYVNKNKKNFYSLGELEGYTIAMPENFFMQKYIEKNYPQIKQIKQSNLVECMKLLSLGKVDAVIGKKIVVDKIIEEHLISNILVTDYIDKEDTISHVRIGASKKDKILIDLLKKAQDQVSERELNLLKIKWFGVNTLKESNKEVLFFSEEEKYIIIIMIISIIVFILSFYLYKYYKYKKIKEQNLQHEAKMVSMGEMLANISHQWKQPLNEINSIIMNMDLDYQKNRLDYERLDEHLLKIESLTKYMSQTITDFNMFISEDKEKKEFFIKSSIDEILRIVEHSLNNKGILYINKIDQSLCVKNFENDFKQALLVIVQNSIDAIIENKMKEGIIEFSAFIEDNDLIIEISDNGGGIPKNILNRIFEPYFTTKQKATNIGIGLYFTYKIIKIHMKGNIVALNNEKNGTSFYIRIPIN